MKLRVNVQTKFYDADGGNAYNVIAELPGTDPALQDEVVMIGGHLDSLAHRRRRHRQRRRRDDGDGSDADPEGDRRAAAADDSRGAVGRRRAGAARLEGLGRGSISPARPTRGARQVRRLLQHRQRHRADLRLVPAEQRSRASRSSTPGSSRSRTSARAATSSSRSAPPII